MAPTTSKYYKAAISLLKDSFIFCGLLATSNTPDHHIAATSYLIDTLEYLGAPDNMMDPTMALQKFLSFCGQPIHAQLMSPALDDAWQARQVKSQIQITRKKWLVYHVGLNWDSDKQAACRDLLLSHMQKNCKVIAPYLAAPYPPPGSWVANTKSAYDKWHAYLEDRVLHDNRTGSTLKILWLDHKRLIWDIGPHEDAYIVDENGVFPTSGS
jgi:hypothetical protein